MNKRVQHLHSGLGGEIVASLAPEVTADGRGWHEVVFDDGFSCWCPTSELIEDLHAF